MSEKRPFSGGPAPPANSQHNSSRHTLLRPVSKLRNTLYMLGKDLEAAKHASAKSRILEMERSIQELTFEIDQHLDSVFQHRQS